MKYARPRSFLRFFLAFPVLFPILLSIGCGQGAMTSNPNPMPGPTPSPAVTNPNNFVYITVNDASMIAGLKVDPSGNMSAIAGSPFPAPEGPVGLARTQDFLFVGSAGLLPLTSDKSVITTFRLDQTTGAITQVAVVHTLFPYNLAVDPFGRFLYATHPDGVAVFTIGASGGLTPIPGSPFGDPSDISDMQGPLTVHSSGKFLYSTGWPSGHGTSPSTVFASIDQASGTLSNGQMIGPDTLSQAITPDGKFMVTANWDGGLEDGLCTFSLDSGTGAPSGASLGGKPVTPIECISTAAYVANVAVSPDNSLVAAAVGGAVSVFKLANGRLSQVAGSPFPSSSPPTLLSFSRDGKFLFGIGPLNTITPAGFTAFRVDVSSGTLTPVPGTPLDLNGQPFQLLP